MGSIMFVVAPAGGHLLIAALDTIIFSRVSGAGGEIVMRQCIVIMVELTLHHPTLLADTVAQDYILRII